MDTERHKHEAGRNEEDCIHQCPWLFRGDRFSNMYSGVALPHCSRILICSLTSVHHQLYHQVLCPCKEWSVTNIQPFWRTVLTSIIRHMPQVERKTLPNIMV